MVQHDVNVPVTAGLRLGSAADQGTKTSDLEDRQNKRVVYGPALKLCSRTKRNDKEVHSLQGTDQPKHNI